METKKFAVLFLLGMVLLSSHGFAWYNTSRIYRQNISIISTQTSTITNVIFPLQNSTSCPLSWALLPSLSFGNNTLHGYFTYNCSDMQYVDPSDTFELNSSLESNTDLPSGMKNVSWNTIYNSSYIYVFPMDDFSNSTQVNRLGSAPNITVFGSKVSSISGGIFGRALSFDSDTANITNGYSNAFGINNVSITLEVWIKSYAVTGTRGIMGFNIPNYEVGLTQNSVGAIRFSCYNVGSCFDITSSAGVITANTTTYIVAKTDGARAFLYANGNSLINGTMSKLMPPPTSAQVWSLGSSVSGGLSNYYGIIDHVVISANNNLSDAEIKARYEAATNRYFLGIESYTAPTPPPANVTGGNVTVTVNVTGLSNNALLFVVILILIIAILLFLTSR